MIRHMTIRHAWSGLAVLFHLGVTIYPAAREAQNTHKVAVEGCCCVPTRGAGPTGSNRDRPDRVPEVTFTPLHGRSHFPKLVGSVVCTVVSSSILLLHVSSGSSERWRLGPNLVPTWSPASYNFGRNTTPIGIPVCNLTCGVHAGYLQGSMFGLPCKRRRPTSAGWSPHGWRTYPRTSRAWIRGRSLNSLPDTGPTTNGGRQFF